MFRIMFAVLTVFMVSPAFAQMPTLKMPGLTEVEQETGNQPNSAFTIEYPAGYGPVTFIKAENQEAITFFDDYWRNTLVNDFSMSRDSRPDYYYAKVYRDSKNYDLITIPYGLDICSDINCPVAVFDPQRGNKTVLFMLSSPEDKSYAIGPMKPSGARPNIFVKSYPNNEAVILTYDGGKDEYDSE